MNDRPKDTGLPDNETFNRLVADEVRAILARRKIPQKELQDNLGWSRASVNRRYNGVTTWQMRDLIALCDYLDIDVAAVLGAAKRVARERASGSVEGQLREYLSPAQQAEVDEAARSVAPKFSDDEHGTNGGRQTG